MTYVHLKTWDGHYLCAEAGGWREVNATRTVAGAWETFDLEFHPSGPSHSAGGTPPMSNMMTLRSCYGEYVTAEGGGGSDVNSNRDVASTWETFVAEGIATTNPVLHGGETIHIKTSNGHYVCAENGGGGTVDATRSVAAQWETFTVELAPAPNYTPTFTVDLQSFEIDNTRSRHTDTDFVTFAAGSKLTPSTPVVKAMGDLNNGVYAVNMTAGPIDVTEDGLTLAYHVVNSGHTDMSAVESVLRSAANALIQAGEKWLDGQVDQNNPVSGPVDDPNNQSQTSVAEAQIAKEVVALAALLAGEAANLGITAFFANCDGVCVADTIAIDTRTLLRLTAYAPHTERRYYAGSNSPSGCGSNSQYYATWTVSRS